MRRVLVVLLVALTALLVAPSATTQPPEVMPFDCVEYATGFEYGTEHVSPAAQAGLLPEDHSPGMHRGFAQCVAP